MAKARVRAGRRDSTRDGRAGPDSEGLVELYRQMVLVRVFEEACQRSFRKGKIGGYLHLIPARRRWPRGFRQAFRAGDKVITVYRVHAHALMLGCDLWAVMVELYGRRDGLVNGKGGPYAPLRRRPGAVGRLRDRWASHPVGCGVRARTVPPADRPRLPVLPGRRVASAAREDEPGARTGPSPST